MTDVGIELPNNIVAYLILFKFPPILENLKRQIMHVEKQLTVDVVFNHLIQYNNERKAQSKTPKSNSDLTLVTTKVKSEKETKRVKMRCREGYHDPNAPHSESSCFHLHPENAPSWWVEQQNKWKSKMNKQPTINYHALLNLWINANSSPNLLLDSGANIHIFNDERYFHSLLMQDEPEEVKTGKLEANLKIRGTGTVKLEWKDSVITLENCAYIPDIVVNLISPGLLASKGCNLTQS